MKFQISRNRYKDERQSKLSLLQSSNANFKTAYSNQESSGEREMSSLSLKRKLKPAQESYSFKFNGSRARLDSSLDDHNRFRGEEIKNP
jgi:hypothetical protein